MDSLKPKKLALLYTLQILERHTDSNHPLTSEEIVARLYSDYGISVERKAVGRNLSLLAEAGYDIVTGKSGSYLNSRLFEDAELRLLSDGVLSSRHITATHSKQIIGKLASLSNKYFKPRVKNVCSVGAWGKSDNYALFYNIDVIDDAISKNVKIVFDYNKYGADKKLHRTSAPIVSPYQIILHNQRYFLVAHQEKWRGVRYFRLDRITNIRLTDEPSVNLRSLEGYGGGIDYKRFASALPYMYSDELQTVKLIVVSDWVFDQIVDWFGFDFTVEHLTDGRYVITLKVSPNAMEYWAMQYLNYVEVASPASLREKILSNVCSAAEKYSKPC